ncbi:hypothetical protein GCM10023094_34940 [Rhodococcus olei]|uniref:Uncharacterized protein n=1 Tax=Rhodococcus olei TaxID=2161675 RepID=A0ABP8PAM1_9NOCA
MRLFRLACEYLISMWVIRPGPVTARRRVAAHARAQAKRETSDRLAYEFTPKRYTQVDALPAVDPAIGMTR